MSGAFKIFSNFKELLDVTWGSIADGQYLRRSGTSIVGGTPAGGGGTGDVVGPATSVANELAIYSDTTGKLIGRLTKAQLEIDLALNNCDNTSDANKPVSTAQQTALNLKEDKANKGAVSGYASLDATGKVPVAQLPATGGAHATTHITGGGDVIPAPTTSASGLVPALPAGSDPTYVLRGDGTFAGRSMVTATTATFTCPAYFASVAGVSILSAPWLSVGDKVFIFGFGQFNIAAKASNTSVTLFNTGDAGNASSGTVPSGTEVRESGMVNVGEVWAYTYQDHFMTGSDGSYTNWTANGTGATKGQAASTADHPGVYFLTSGTSAGAAATGYAFMTTNNGLVVGTGGAVAFRCVLLAPSTKPTSTAANLCKIYIGLGTQPANGTFPGADFIGFVFDPSSGMTNAANNWGFLSRKASVNTFTDTGYVYSTTNYADLSFIFDGTNANFRAYQWAGTAQAKSANVTSNVPLTTTPLCTSFFILNGAAGTTSYTAWLDMWEVAYKGPTAVPTFRGTNLLKNF
jgi:hypothetical protein